MDATTDFSGWRMELGRTTETLLDEIADPQMTQRDVALTYLLAIRSSEQTDWPRVNRAIMERWSRSGLLRVKRMVEKLATTARYQRLLCPECGWEGSVSSAVERGIGPIQCPNCDADVIGA